MSPVYGARSPSLRMHLTAVVGSWATYSDPVFRDGVSGQVISSHSVSYNIQLS